MSLRIASRFTIVAFGLSLGFAAGCDKDEEQERNACVEAQQHVEGCLQMEVDLLTCDESGAEALLDLQCEQIQQAVSAGKSDSVYCQMFGLGCD